MATQPGAAVPRVAPWRRRLRNLFVYLGVPYLSVLVLLASFQRSLIYVPTRETELPPKLVQLPHGKAEAVTCRTSDGIDLHGWWIGSTAPPKPAAEQGGTLAEERPLVIYFCGNAGNRSFRLGEFEILTSAGADVLCCDYRGYGDNAGHPSETGLARDAQAVWELATSTRRVAPERIILFGESLGGAVAIQLAHELCDRNSPPAGLIVRSTFTSLGDVAATAIPWIPARWLLIDRYPSIDRIPHVTCPLLALHGLRDTIVPYSLGHKLFSRAPKTAANGIEAQFVELPQADHNDVLDTERTRFRIAVTRFVARAARGKP